MKKIFILTVSAIFFLSMLVTPSFAGSKQRYRWQGIAIGVGAAILGHAILESCRDYSPPERVIIDRPCGPVYSPPRRAFGHWEVRRVWVKPECEKVWNPAHYNRYGEWVPGEYIMIQTTPGHWSKERVWVARR